jgi:hypothetical protein
MKAALKTGPAGVNIDINPAFSFNGNAAQIVYSSASFVAAPANKTGSCVNISCHFQPSPKWSVKDN